MALFKKGTFCPRLWEEIFIDPKGDVYSCCHFKPRIAGNIYKEDLRSICNNEAMQSLRKESLDGRLKCFSACSLLEKEKIAKTRDKLTIDYSELVKLKVEFSQACNIRCVMCWQDHENKGELDCERLIQNVDIAPFRRIEIQGGEPFFIESAKIFFDYAISKEKKISFVTNGLLIDEAWAEKIARHSAFVHISLNAATKETHEFINRGSKWDTVLDNIQKIRNARRRFNTDVKIIGHMTIVTRNIKEIPLFIENFNRFGFDCIKFGYDKNIPSFLRENVLLKKSLCREIRLSISRSFIADIGLKIDTHRLKLLSLI